MHLCFLALIVWRVTLSLCGAGSGRAVSGEPVRAWRRSATVIIEREKLPAIMARLQRLRARPESHRRVLEAVNQPQSSIDDIADAITHDVALTAHILKVANSAAFAPSKKVASAKEAVSLIGSVRLKALVSTAWAFQLFDESKKVAGFDA